LQIENRKNNSGENKNVKGKKVTKINKKSNEKKKREVKIRKK
jgi:hypothetical protein